MHAAFWLIACSSEHRLCAQSAHCQFVHIVSAPVPFMLITIPLLHRIWIPTCLATPTVSMGGLEMRALPQLWLKPVSLPWTCAMLPWDSMIASLPRGQQVNVSVIYAHHNHYHC